MSFASAEPLRAIQVGSFEHMAREAGERVSNYTRRLARKAWREVGPALSPKALDTRLRSWKTRVDEEKGSRPAVFFELSDRWNPIAFLENIQKKYRDSERYKQIVGGK